MSECDLEFDFSLCHGDANYNSYRGCRGYEGRNRLPRSECV